MQQQFLIIPTTIKIPRLSFNIIKTIWNDLPNEKKRGVSGSAADCPPLFFVYFVIVCALLPPGLFMQTAPRKYFRGAVTSAFFISSYLHFIFRHNLSCYFYLTVIYLNYQLSLIYICLECYLMSVAAGLFCRKMDGRFCRKKPDTDVRRAGRIDVAGVFCRTREGRGQSRSLH